MNPSDPTEEEILERMREIGTRIGLLMLSRGRSTFAVRTYLQTKEHVIRSVATAELRNGLHPRSIAASWRRAPLLLGIPSHEPRLDLYEETPHFLGVERARLPDPQG